MPGLAPGFMRQNKGERSSALDDTGGHMKSAKRSNAFSFFQKLAADAGFGVIREHDLRTLAVLKTSAAQEAAAGSPWTIDFFKDDSAGEATNGDTSPALDVTRTKKPV